VMKTMDRHMGMKDEDEARGHLSRSHDRGTVVKRTDFEVHRIVGKMELISGKSKSSQLIQ
jgi:hypothetical protein